MNQKLQHGAIRASVLINILLGIGILSAIVFLLFLNTKETETKQQQIISPTVNSISNTSVAKAPSAPLEKEQIDELKSNLEIETLKLERLRIQTEKVRASQRRAQSVNSSSSTKIIPADTAELGRDKPGSP